MNLSWEQWPHCIAESVEPLLGRNDAVFYARIIKEGGYNSRSLSWEVCLHGDCDRLAAQLKNWLGARLLKSGDGYQGRMDPLPNDFVLDDFVMVPVAASVYNPRMNECFRTIIYSSSALEPLSCNLDVTLGSFVLFQSNTELEKHVNADGSRCARKDFRASGGLDQNTIPEELSLHVERHAPWMLNVALHDAGLYLTKHGFERIAAYLYGCKYAMVPWSEKFDLGFTANMATIGENEVRLLATLMPGTTRSSSSIWSVTLHAIDEKPLNTVMRQMRGVKWESEGGCYRGILHVNQEIGRSATGVASRPSMLRKPMHEVADVDKKLETLLVDASYCDYEVVAQTSQLQNWYREYILSPKGPAPAAILADGTIPYNSNDDTQLIIQEGELWRGHLDLCLPIAPALPASQSDQTTLLRDADVSAFEHLHAELVTYMPWVLHADWHYRLTNAGVDKLVAKIQDFGYEGLAGVLAGGLVFSLQSNKIPDRAYVGLQDSVLHICKVRRNAYSPGESWQASLSSDSPHLVNSILQATSDIEWEVRRGGCRGILKNKHQSCKEITCAAIASGYQVVAEVCQGNQHAFIIAPPSDATPIASQFGADYSTQVILQASKNVVVELVCPSQFEEQVKQLAPWMYGFQGAKMSQASIRRVLSLITSSGFELASTRAMPEGSNVIEYTWRFCGAMGRGDSDQKNYVAVNSSKSLATMTAQVHDLTEALNGAEQERDFLRSRVEELMRDRQRTEAGVWPVVA